ncbi:hypothetical protein [Phytoactinopolyspora limicola]|uniref:hypothetical protein n=1 Tax=Phytoactinopolyspora limicola TaxID=2715536 RepID=UPI0014093F4A|nr:hypothetical protein [Phytoactinopolyspora limicola]
MSQYVVNKFMRLVNMDPAALEAYVADPASFVAAFEADVDPDRQPWSVRGGRLEDHERRALVERDYGALYALGAHPYLLWSFTEAVWVPEITRAELVQRFRAAVTPFGYPDFGT